MALTSVEQTRFGGVVHWFRTFLGVSWLVFQLYIIWYPQAPLVQRPLHLILALALFFLWNPLNSRRLGPGWGVVVDSILTAATCAGGAYYLLSSTRLTERMEGIDPVGVVDICFGILLLTVLLEAVRRAVGWSLLTVLLLFLGYAFVGQWVPGWLSFSGFSLEQAVEILTMSLNGILGITTQTSLQFVFYFIVFGAVYSSIGGSQLFIDIGLRLGGQHRAGAAKAAVVSSSLMGSISGSAVANVAATGVFTIPLMRKAGYSRERSAAIEAISSTGGQLMPPIMGVAAFLLAEMLQTDYTSVALAGLIPALAFYATIFVQVDLDARKTGVGTVQSEITGTHPPILGRIYLLTPPAVLVLVLLSGYSATYAATVATAACIVIGLVQPGDRLDLRRPVGALIGGTRQASQVAIPISAIGIIIAVAIQSISGSQVLLPAGRRWRGLLAGLHAPDHAGLPDHGYGPADRSGLYYRCHSVRPDTPRNEHLGNAGTFLRHVLLRLVHDHASGSTGLLYSCRDSGKPDHADEPPCLPSQLRLFLDPLCFRLRSTLTWRGLSWLGCGGFSLAVGRQCQLGSGPGRLSQSKSRFGRAPAHRGWIRGADLRAYGHLALVPGTDFSRPFCVLGLGPAARGWRPD